MRVMIAALVLAGGLGWSARSMAEDNAFVIHPGWLRTPSAADLRSLYPSDGKGATGMVRADCLIDDKGRLSACEIVSEDPAGRGFGESTVKLSRQFQMKTTDREGVPVAGRKLHLPVRWDPPQH